MLLLRFLVSGPAPPPAPLYFLSARYFDDERRAASRSCLRASPSCVRRRGSEALSPAVQAKAPRWTRDA